MVTAGLIVPPRPGRVPPDAARMYPATRFLVEGIGLGGMNAESYAKAEGRVRDAAGTLAGDGAAGVLLFGTSLSFFRGPRFNAELEARMEAAAGRPARTLTTAMVRALSLLGARRLAVATAYGDEVNEMFRAYFEEQRFGIEAIDGMDLTALDTAEETGEVAIGDLVRQVAARAPGAEALVVSCAGLTTAGICPALEAELGLPVVSSAMVGAWAAQGLAGGKAQVEGFGQLYAMEVETW